MKTTNTLGALLALSILGCSGDPMTLAPTGEHACTPGESRGCACPSGAMGAQVCEGDGSGLGPCVCAVDDGGLEELDAGARRPPYVDPLDAGTDAGPPFVEVDAGPVWRDAGPRACDLAAQTGCGRNEACRMRWRGPECEPAGRWDPDFYDSCEGEDRSDLCPAGAFCSGGGTTCRYYCDLDDPRWRCPDTLDGRRQGCEEWSWNGWRFGVCMPTTPW